MKLLSFPIGLLSLLLSYGVVEAQQDLYSDCLHKGVDGTTYDICRIPDMRKILKDPNDWIWVDESNGMIATCNEEMTRCWTPCEVKMKEAMKLADGTLFNRPAYTTPRSFEEREQRYRNDKAAWVQWEDVMKECVK